VQVSKPIKSGLLYGAAAGLIVGLILRTKILWCIAGGMAVGFYLAKQIENNYISKEELERPLGPEDENGEGQQGQVNDSYNQEQ